MQSQPQEIPTVYSVEMVRHNSRQVYTSRVTMSIVTGCACGVLGLEGVSGLLFYMAISCTLGVAMLFKAGWNTKDYFIQPSAVFMEGLSQGVGSFVLFWTLMYDVVHLF